MGTYGERCPYSYEQVEYRYERLTQLADPSYYFSLPVEEAI